MAAVFKHELGNLWYISREDFENGIERALKVVTRYGLGPQIIR